MFKLEKQDHSLPTIPQLETANTCISSRLLVLTEWRFGKARNKRRQKNEADWQTQGKCRKGIPMRHQKSWKPGVNKKKNNYKSTPMYSAETQMGFSQSVRYHLMIYVCWLGNASRMNRTKTAVRTTVCIVNARKHATDKARKTTNVLWHERWNIWLGLRPLFWLIWHEMRISGMLL